MLDLDWIPGWTQTKTKKANATWRTQSYGPVGIHGRRTQLILGTNSSKRVNFKNSSKRVYRILTTRDSENYSKLHSWGNDTLWFKLWAIGPCRTLFELEQSLAPTSTVPPHWTPASSFGNRSMLHSCTDFIALIVGIWSLLPIPVKLLRMWEWPMVDD